MLDARYVIGADGAQSTVRGLVGVGFAGTAYSLPMLLADVRIPGSEPPPITQVGPQGVVVTLPFGDGWYRVGAWLREDREDAGFDRIRTAFRQIAGTDYGMSEPRWFSRFAAERRQARAYRAGRVFLAGDAAHVNSPIGGQGMNTGIQDAANLGWKLAADLGGWAPPGLLGTYHPLVGRRAPDRWTDVGRLYEVLRAGRFVLLSDEAVPVHWRDRVRQARPEDATGPAATLVRPDGYVAWAGDSAGVEAALVEWCGPADRTDLEGHRATA